MSTGVRRMHALSPSESESAQADFAATGPPGATSVAGQPATVVVLGLGNLLRRDEGLGVRALQLLEASYILPDGVRLVDGGTLGLDLISHVEGAEYLLVLDAMLTDGPPGGLLRLAGEEIPAFFGIRNSHDVGLADLLAVLKLRETEPREVVVLGMQPGAVELGWGLSREVEERLGELVEAAAGELRRWGLAIAPRPALSDKEECDA